VHTLPTLQSIATKVNVGAVIVLQVAWASSGGVTNESPSAERRPTVRLHFSNSGRHSTKSSSHAERPETVPNARTPSRCRYCATHPIGGSHLAQIFVINHVSYTRFACIRLSSLNVMPFSWASDRRSR